MQYVVLFFSVAVPGLLHAAPLVPCDGALGKVCNACEMVQLGQNIIGFLTTLTVISSVLIFMFAGFKMVTSAGNASQVEQAKGLFSNVIVGLMIILAAWLIIDTLMKAPFVDQSKFGPWNQIQCVAEPSVAQGTGSVTPTTPTVPDTSTPTPVPSTAPIGGTQVQIAAAANAYIGASTASGPGGGTVACVWAVNNVLRNAGLAPFTTDNVITMESQLKGGRGTLVSQSQAQPGDIVVVVESAQKAHTGICLTVGCTQVISNSSGTRSFSWRSDTTFAPSYNVGPGRIYRVTK